MRSREQSILSEILPPEERAIEAVVARYQRVAPAVTRFARSLAGNDTLRVRLGAEASAGVDDVVLVTDRYHAKRSALIAREVGLVAAVSPTPQRASLQRLARETVAVSIGRVISFRRLDRL